MTSPPVDAPLITAIALRFPKTRVLARSLAAAISLIAAIVLVAMLARAAGSERGDFETYYSGAWNIRQGTHLYDRALAWREAGFAIKSPGPQPVNGSPYVYPPIFAIALLPLSFLSLKAASAAWIAITAGCLVGTAYVLIGLLFPSLRAWFRLPAILGLGALITLFQPARSILFTGQADAVLLLFMTLALAAFARGRDSRAAILLALAAAIKPTAVFLIAFLLWKRAYRAAALATAAAAALILLPFAFLGLGAATDALAATQYWSGPLFGVSPVNQSPYGLLLRLFTPNVYTVPLVDAPMVAMAVRVVVSATILGLLVVTVSRSRAVPASRLALEYGLAIVGMLLVGPLSEDNHYLYLAIPFVATAVILLTRPQLPGRIPLAALVALVLGYLSMPTLIALDNAFYSYYVAPIAWPRSLLTGMHLYGLCALAVVMFLVARRDSPRNPSANQQGAG